MKNCKFCSNSFAPTRSFNIYCSIKCRQQANDKTKEKNCTFCGKDFIGRKGQVLCSPDCYYKRKCDLNFKTAALRRKYPLIEGLDRQQIYKKFNPEKGIFMLDKDNSKRTVVIQYLGGRCSLCYYDSDIRALQLDHINGDGKEDRKKHGNRVCRYYVNNLKESKINLQVLCANCHAIKTYIAEEYTRKKK